ncbi:hypothetical protein GGR58DRAFT_484149 [Xylaria digitata]|nr:hypothetical protein GGR58DRAFT_484149 [Xylaria digitata]
MCVYSSVENNYSHSVKLPSYRIHFDMSGLETLGIVCNIFQVISFAHETVTLCKKVYRTGTGVDQEVSENAVFLEKLSSQVVGLDLDAPGVRSADEQQLLDTLKKCRDVSRDLREEINFITEHAKKGSLASTLKIAAKTNWRKRRLEKLERKLNDAQRLMETSLLVRISNRLEIESLNLDVLAGDLKSFVRRYKTGERTLVGLVSVEALKTRAHISSASTAIEHNVSKNTAIEVQRSARDISSHIARVVDDSTATVRRDLHELQLNAESSVHRDRLLSSLKFAGMNERRQQIKESFPNTFQWVFGDEFDNDRKAESDDESGGNEDTTSGDAREFPSAEYPYCISKWDSFEDWLRSGTSVYWISGKPGSGKTTLVKYLLSSERTRDALAVWNRDYMMLSHFFWRPGTSIQQNIKGLLCNMLHQIIEADTTLIEYMTSHFPETGQKSTHTDWSVPELMGIFLALMKRFEKPVCIFLDGLDEVDPDDGVWELFEVIEKIRQIPRTKLCLSSRPEPPIRKRLTEYPQLRLEDLTRGDTWKYAKGMLKFPSSYSGEKHKIARHEILRGLVEKAEGVFLWLCLAIKTLSAGLENGDSLEEVARRANGLPTSLADLYKDMWSRANEHHAIYRQEAAFYFKIILASKRNPTSFTIRFCLSYPNISVFEMALIIFGSKFGLQRELIPAERLYGLCLETERLIQTRCAGLLEIGQSEEDSDTYGPEHIRRPEYDGFPHFGDGSRTIKFIHRSAFDFLTDTAEGQDILSKDMTSERFIYASIFRAGLSSRYLLRPGSMRRLDLERCVGELGRIWNIPSDHHSSEKLMLYETALFLESFGSSGDLVLGWQRRHKSTTLENHEFLVYATRQGLYEFVMMALTERNVSSQLKSDILLSAVRSALERPMFGHSHEYLKMAEHLLGYGADPNYRGYAIPSDSFQPVLTASSPFGTFLEQLIGYGLQDYDLGIDPHRILHIMDAFLKHGASISEQVNLNLYVLPNDQIGPLPLEDLFTFRVVSGRDLSIWYRKRWSNGQWVHEAQPDAKFCLLLVPSSILISAYIERFERRVSENIPCKVDYCGADHVTSIKRRIALAHHHTEPQVIALPQGSLDDLNLPFRSVTNDDSTYLSNAVITFLSGPCMAYDKKILAEKYLEVYERSEGQTNLEAVIEARDLAMAPDWDNYIG